MLFYLIVYIGVEKHERHEIHPCMSSNNMIENEIINEGLRSTLALHCSRKTKQVQKHELKIKLLEDQTHFKMLNVVKSCFINKYFNKAYLFELYYLS